MEAFKFDFNCQSFTDYFEHPYFDFKSVNFRINLVMAIAVVVNFTLNLDNLVQNSNSQVVAVKFIEQADSLEAGKVQASAFAILMCYQVDLAFPFNIWRKHFQPYFCFPLDLY